MFYDYYTFEATKDDVFVKQIVVRASSEWEAYQKAYTHTPDGCCIELTEIEPAI